MAVFHIQIAGQVARVESIYDSTRDYCIRYLTERSPDFTITVRPEDLEYEQRELREEALREGIRVRIFTDPFLERAAIQRQLADRLLGHETLLVHGSTVAMDGGAYLFTAKCGVGKSTHTRLWRQAFPGRAEMVNDDKPFLQIGKRRVIAHGSPWSGKHGLDTNCAVPLQGICVLERGTVNEISRIDPAQVLPLLREQTYLPDHAPHAQQLLERLVRQVPCWRMGCTKDLEAAYVAYEAMCGSRS